MSNLSNIDNTFGGIEEEVSKDSLIEFMEKTLGKKLGDTSFQLFNEFFKLKNFDISPSSNINWDKAREMYRQQPITNDPSPDSMSSSSTSLASTYEIPYDTVVASTITPETPEKTPPYNKEPEKQLRRSIIL